jgi:hypothetical protein
MDEYINNQCSDKIQRLTKLPAKFLSRKDKEEILNNFFILNEENLLIPNYRYRELFESAKNKTEVLNN